MVKEIANANQIYISIISELEFKSFAKISLNDINLFDDFGSMISVLDLNAADNQLKSNIIEIRKTHKLKLPDEIIAAAALVNDAILFTADKGFRNVKGLKLKLLST